MIEPKEIEFLAEKRLISIEPNFNHGVIHLISGPIGPFRAGLPVRVPLWLALDLKKQQKCRIIPEEWMNIEELEENIKEEKLASHFTRMPNHYMEQAQMMLNAAPDNIPDVDKIRTAVKDLWDCRITKLRTSVIKFFENDSSYARLDNLTSMEMLSVRTLLNDALNTMQFIHESAKPSSSQRL